MIKLTDIDKCTACGACGYVCPKGCISMAIDKINGRFPLIDNSNCIGCKKCIRACPILTPIELHYPIKAYAARSFEPEEAVTSASGGVATALYKDAISNNKYIVGAEQNANHGVVLQVDNTLEAVYKFKNSKYVFSECYSLFPQLDDLLKQNAEIVIAGLPCQIAAIRKIFRNHPNLFLIDIVCHGTTPTDFLIQHIKSIENKLGQTAKRMSFRDPAFDTHKFVFSLYNESDECFYSKRTKDGDTYQYGYHRAISYRENCYHCPFANPNRAGDISLADFPGLGKTTPFPFNKRNISLVLVNTPKGDIWFKDKVERNIIQAYERPIEEPIKGNGQLRRPVPKKRDRISFEKSLRNNGVDFESAMHPIMNKGLQREKIDRLKKIPTRFFRKINRLLTKIFS